MRVGYGWDFREEECIGYWRARRDLEIFVRWCRVEWYFCDCERGGWDGNMYVSSRANDGFPSAQRWPKSWLPRLSTFKLSSQFKSQEVVTQELGLSFTFTSSTIPTSFELFDWERDNPEPFIPNIPQYSIASILPCLLPPNIHSKIHFNYILYQLCIWLKDFVFTSGESIWETRIQIHMDVLT